MEKIAKSRRLFWGLCLLWTVIIGYLIFLHDENRHPLPDEISIETNAGKGTNFFRSVHSILRAYRENGKYYLECIDASNDKTLYELTKKEYQYCADIDLNRFEDFHDWGWFAYNIIIRYGDNVKEYECTGMENPLFELCRTHAMKSINTQSLLDMDQEKVVTAFETFCRKCHITAAMINYSRDSRERPPLHGGTCYGRFFQQKFTEDYKETDHSHFRELILNVMLMECYEKGMIERPNLYSELASKEKILEQFSESDLIDLGISYHANNVHEYIKDLLREDDERIISRQTKQYIMKNAIRKLRSYTHKAYGDITYGKNGVCIYQVYFPKEEIEYKVVIQKPSLMPKWFLEISLNTILLNGVSKSIWGSLYRGGSFIFFSILGWIVLKIIFSFVKKKVANKKSVSE